MKTTAAAFGADGAVQVVDRSSDPSGLKGKGESQACCRVIFTRRQLLSYAIVHTASPLVDRTDMITCQAGKSLLIVPYGTFSPQVLMSCCCTETL